MATIIEYRKKFIELFDQMQNEHGHCDRVDVFNSMKDDEGFEITCRIVF